MAAEEETICDGFREAGDTGWLISCGVMVMTMQGGFALLESGSVRINNSVNILVKNMFDLGLGALGFWAFGWGLSYGKSAGGFLGTDQFFPEKGLDSAMWFFQMSFAATASTIDSGACAERMKLGVYCGMSLFMTTFTYPIAAHWVWNKEGWLHKMGYTDLAGVSVVHVLGGSSAFVCAKMLGPRLGMLGYPVPDELKPVEKHLRLSHKVFRGESIHQLFGSMLLLFGWVGFNAGSSLQLSGDGQLMAGYIAFTTILGSCGGMCAGAALGMATSEGHIIPPEEIATGLLTGLVSVTGCAHVVHAYAAIIIGAIGGVVGIGSMRMLTVLRVDDPVGVLPVHLFAGIWGNLATGLFAAPPECVGMDEQQPGLLNGGGAGLLGVQLLGVIVIIVWSAFWTWLYLVITEKVFHIPIRVVPVQEMVGNDVLEHGVDVFKRLKYTAVMQKMMTKMNPVKDDDASLLNKSQNPTSSHAPSQSAISTHASTASAMFAGKKSPSKRKSRIAPAPGSKKAGAEGEHVALGRSASQSASLFRKSKAKGNIDDSDSDLDLDSDDANAVTAAESTTSAVTLPAPEIASSPAPPVDDDKAPASARLPNEVDDNEA